VAASLPDWVLSSPWVFLFGVIVGLAVSSRWVIVRRNGRRNGRDEKT
jgi:hypothetical protein